MDVNELSDLDRAEDWVPYVRAARDDREQNVEALLRDGQLHYRSVRTLAAGTELLVWYSRDLALVLGVPELQPFHIKGRLLEASMKPMNSRSISQSINKFQGGN